MKRTLILIITLAMSLSACSRREVRMVSMQNEGPSSAVTESSEATEMESLQEEEGPFYPDTIVSAPMDAAMYRGTVRSVEMQDGDIALVLAQAPGTNFGTPELTVILDKNTKSGFDFATIKPGNYLEVYYGIPMEGGIPVDVVAIVVNRHLDATSTIYNGTIVEIEAGEGGGRILLSPLEGNTETLFRYSDATQFYLDINALKPGDKLNIFFSGITTRSIPPQANALEVRYYAEPAK